MTDLSTFFRPRGVAIVGASRDPDKLGHSLMKKLIQYNYRGQIYPINPKAEEVLGWKCYTSVTQAPDPLDLAVIIIPAPYVERVLVECIERKVSSIVIISGGFRETGPEGAKREQRLKEIIEANGVHVIGPNCVGLMDTHTPLNVTFLKDMPAPGEIGFLSHSGALCAAVINWARQAGVGFSRIVSLGNQVDVTQTDLLTTFVDDSNTRVITLYLEGVDDGPEFIEVARAMSLKRPILAIKAGTGEAGARAVSSHTGALAGQDAAYSAAFRRAGILRATTMEELFNWARALAWQPLPKGNRVGVLTNAGGLGVMAADAIEAAGLKLAELTEETKAFLRERTPPAASVENPVDVLGGSGSATYGLAMDALLRDPNVDVVCVMQAPADWFSVPSLAEVVGEIAGYARKPVLACMMGLEPMGEAAQVLNRRQIPNYTFPEQLGSTLAAMWARCQWLDAQAAGDQQPAEQITADTAAARAILEGKHGLLPPEDAGALMKLYGIAAPGAGLASTPGDAAKLADEIGYPVVLKIASPDIVHKIDVGGVVVGLEDADAVRAEAAAMIERARQAKPGAAIQGVHVQQMVKGKEIIVGVTRDPQFGPLVMVGSGGTAVELTKDVAFDLAPLARKEAAAMLDRTTAGPILGGYRGAPGSDRAAAEAVITRLAQLAIDLPQINEIEINPVIVRGAGEGALAVDVRVLLK
ncbi:MAG: acetate--CoA ligase family protein [Anaerolineae bacterium]|nr:acetate--CoA ligase family protein [Anaerolineae bacterium]